MSKLMKWLDRILPTGIRQWLMMTILKRKIKKIGGKVQ